jgi:protein-L-isoaspartate(D-aspartate) O-methyltransferase
VSGEAQGTGYAERRLRMVEHQIVSRGVRDRDVVAAMRSVPRHLFIPEQREHEAYYDCALPIGSGQTISQPYIVALMTSLLRVDARSRVLEIGTGSGYQAAVLAEVVSHVTTIERVEELETEARERLQRLGYRNITTVLGDGSLGLPDEAPFDGIIVTAAAPAPPAPLLEQLGPGARLVAPIGPAGRDQMLTVITNTPHGLETTTDVACRFVPLLGEAAFTFGSEG